MQIVISARKQSKVSYGYRAVMFCEVYRREGTEQVNEDNVPFLTKIKKGHKSKYHCYTSYHLSERKHLPKWKTCQSLSSNAENWISRLEITCGVQSGRYWYIKWPYAFGSEQLKFGIDITRARNIGPVHS